MNYDQCPDVLSSVEFFFYSRGSEHFADVSVFAFISSRLSFRFPREKVSENFANTLSGAC